MARFILCQMLTNIAIFVTIVAKKYDSTFSYIYKGGLVGHSVAI